MGNSLRIDDAVVHVDGRLEFKLKEGDAPLSLVPSNDGLIFPGGREQFVQDLQEFQALITNDLRYKLFMLLAQVVKDDPQLRPNTITAMRNRTITVDFTSPAKVITL